MKRSDPFANLSLTPATATAIIVVTAFCFGLVPLFARELQALGLNSPAIALVRYLFSAAVMLPFLPRAREKRGEALMLAGAGLFMGLGWVGYLEAVRHAPVAAAGVVYMSYPLFAVLFAWLLAGQKLGVRALGAGSLVLLAAGLVLDPSTLTDGAVAALLWSLPAPVGFGLIIVVLSALVRRLAVLERMACSMLGALIGLAPLTLSRTSLADIPLGGEALALIAGLGLVTALIPQLLYTIAAPMVGAARSAAAGSVELPTMFAIGWLAFGESIGPREWIAAALVISAVLLSPAVRPKRDAGDLLAQRQPV
ncbi:DMT family transporter [Marivibrio halodurans]|uniref:DMT family transporter n=1 Tax=Marivibrio halodurans TaxID=2039722 RepID=A0A8J7S7Y0_9PROT|nr:DMT family transporter [Marivibrio halodurans]MBP5858474.1 DMT family transporter [Marivibrio halodurans]